MAAADNERPDSAEPVVTEEAAHVEENTAGQAPELVTSAPQPQPSVDDGRYDPAPGVAAPEAGVWTDAPATDGHFAAGQFEMGLDTEEMPQPPQEAGAPAEEAAEDEGQPEAMMPALATISVASISAASQEQSPSEIELPAVESLAADATANQGALEMNDEAWELLSLVMSSAPAPTASDTSDGHILSTATAAEAAPAPPADGPETHDPSPAQPEEGQDAAFSRSTESVSAVADRAPLDIPPITPIQPITPNLVEPPAEYPIQPTWAQQPTYADAQPWTQQSPYAEAAPPLPDDPPAVPWADSPYVLPVYEPPASGYAQPIAQPAAVPAYPPVVYPLPARPRQGSRWLLLIGTVAAVLVVAVLAVALANYVPILLGRPLYQNSMKSKADGWPDDAECHFAADGYHITSASNCYYDGGDYRDVTISVTATLLKGDPTGAYGIAFRRPSPNNFYVFLIMGNGNWLVLKNAVPLQQATPSTALKAGIGAVNTLSVHAQGSHFTFFANGVQLGSLSDGSYPNGKVGLAGDASTEAVFTDFTVTRG
jgi:hypothetical protein